MTTAEIVSMGATSNAESELIFMRMMGYLERIGAVKEMDEAFKGLNSLFLRYKAYTGEGSETSLDNPLLIRIDLPDASMDAATQDTAEFLGRKVIEAEYREKGKTGLPIDRETAIGAGNIFVRLIKTVANQLLFSTEKLGLEPIVGGQSLHSVAAIDMSAIGFNITAIRETLQKNDDPTKHKVTLRDFDERRLLALRMLNLDLSEDHQFAPSRREWLGGLNQELYFE